MTEYGIYGIEPVGFGSRICDTQILKILDEVILPKYEAQIESDIALDLVITAYVSLVNEMIINQPEIVSELLKGTDE